MKNVILFILSSIFAFMSPFWLCGDNNVSKDEADFPGWPKTYQGSELTQLPITEREKQFDSSFPGKTGRFTDGCNQYIFRWITQPTRKLHPATDCFKAVGYKIDFQPIYVDSEGMSWSVFEAEKDGQKLIVNERIFDTHGNSWTDVSQWYWQSVFHESENHWWAITVIQRK